MKRYLTTIITAFAITGSAAAQTPQMLRRGEVLHWSTTAGQKGLMKVVDVDGISFEVEQTNEMNRTAGVVRLYGAVVDHGRKAVLIGVGQWKEVWEGAIFNDEIEGNIVSASASTPFKISTMRRGMESRENRPATYPFMSGRRLRWETGAAGGQNGEFLVVDVIGSSFRLEQTNRRNVAAGVIKLEGEVKNGKIFLYNRKWKETWVGTFDHGMVSGRVNNMSDFRIFAD